jgi:hypothetical protein
VADDLFTGCAEQLAVSPGLVEQLLRDHGPTPDGWCRQHENHHEQHPCSIRRLAEMASSYAAHRPARRPRA